MILTSFIHMLRTSTVIDHSMKIGQHSLNENHQIELHGPKAFDDYRAQFSKLGQVDSVRLYDQADQEYAYEESKSDHSAQKLVAFNGCLNDEIDELSEQMKYDGHLSDNFGHEPQDDIKQLSHVPDDEADHENRY